MQIATLCGMGFGTSMMLKLTVDDILKKHEIKAKVTPWDLSSYKGQNADIIVAPVDMQTHLKDASARVVLIKNLVDKKEIEEKVIAAIEEIQAAD